MPRLYDSIANDVLVGQTFISFTKVDMLVVGHSNTTEDLLNAIVGLEIYADIPEDENDNLFVVHVS